MKVNKIRTSKDLIR